MSGYVLTLKLFTTATLFPNSLSCEPTVYKAQLSTGGLSLSQHWGTLRPIGDLLTLTKGAAVEGSAMAQTKNQCVMRQGTCLSHYLSLPRGVGR